jgi:hypothetical protein
MKATFVRCAVFFLTLLVFTCLNSVAAADVPWPSKDVLGDLHEQVLELHKGQLIKEFLKEKYVHGDSSFLDVVYNHQYISVNKDGGQVFYSDSAVRANTPQARQALGEITAGFNAAKESVDILLAEVYQRDGTKITTDTASCQTKEPFTSLVYSDLKVKTLSLKGIEEGSIVRVVTKRTFQPDVDKGCIYLQCSLDSLTPVKELLLVVRLEPGARIVKKERIGNPRPSMVAKTYSTGKGETYYVYGASGLKPQVPEASSVPRSEWDNRILFVNPSTWNEVARWWFRLYEPKVSTGAEIKEKAVELTRNHSSRESKIKALYDYVKSIRYVAIHLNEGTYVPHSAEETLRNRYGDCKDKAVLLLSLLRSIGIDGVVALVRVASLTDEELPSPKYFDHAVVAIPAPNQTYAFLDATGSLTPYGLLPEAIQYRHALIPRGNEGELVLIPPQSPDMNRVDETIDAEVQDVRTVTVTGRARTYSSKEWYHMLPSIPQEILLQALKEGMASEYKDFDILSIKRELADEQGVLKSEIVYKVRDFTKKMGKVYIFNPLFDADKLGNEGIVGSPKRKSDIELDGPKRLIATITVNLPASVTVDTLPKPLSIKGSKFGSYSYEVNQSEGMLSIRREVQIDVKRIAAKDYAEFRKFYQACLNQDEELVGLTGR